MNTFGVVDGATIQNGACTDVYFERTEQILAAEGMNPQVTMEITTTSLPWDTGILAGLDSAISLLEGLPVDVEAMPEGTPFHTYEPVMRITGKYRDFMRYETALLGFLCHASGVASAAAAIKRCAGERPVLSFGSRRQHPALAGVIERSAWIGGVDGVSNTAAPEGIPLSGTMPHAYVMCFKNPVDAWTAFEKRAPSEVPRVMLCDTFCDEKHESLAAAEHGATAVRLDTPRSRRGSMREILEEVRWELDLHGHADVEIFLSGGITAEDILQYKDIVNAFGVGGSIANAPVIDFSLDIVAHDDIPGAKRGKRGGVKQVWLLPDKSRKILPVTSEVPKGAIGLLEPFIRAGTVLQTWDHHDARARMIVSGGIAGLPSSNLEK